MTVTALIVSAALAGASAILALGGTGVLARFNRHTDRMMEARDVFFRASRALLNEQETSRVIVDQLEFMAKTINDPRIGRALLVAALRGDLGKAVRNPPQHSLDLRAALERMRPELRRQYGIAASSYLFAATFTNSVLGTLIRRVALFWLIGTDDEPRPATIVITDLDSIHDRPRELVA